MPKKGLTPPVAYPIEYKPNQAEPWKMEWKPKTVTIKVFKQTDAGKQYATVHVVTRTQVLTPEPNLYQFAQASVSGDAALIDVTVDPNFAKQLTDPKTKSTFLVEVKAYPLGAMMAGMAGAAGGYLSGIGAGAVLGGGGKKALRIIQVKDQAQLEPEFPHPYIWVPDIDTQGIQKIKLDSSKKAWTNVDVSVRRFKPPADKFEKTADQLEWKAGGGANQDLVEFEQSSGNVIKVKASRLVISQAGAVFPATVTVSAPKVQNPPTVKPFVDIPVEVSGKPIKLNLSLQLDDGTPLQKLDNATITAEELTIKVSGLRKDVACKVVWEPVAAQTDYDLEQAAKLRLSGTMPVTGAEGSTVELKIPLSTRPVTSGQTLTLHMPSLVCSVSKQYWEAVQFNLGAEQYKAVARAIAQGSPAFKIDVRGSYESPEKVYKIEAPLLNVHASILMNGSAVGSLSATGTAITVSAPLKPMPAQVEPIANCESAFVRIKGYTYKKTPCDAEALKTRFVNFAQAYMTSLLNNTEEDLIKTQPSRLKAGGQVSNSLQGVRLVMVQYDSAAGLYLSAMDEFMDAIFSFSIDAIFHFELLSKVGNFFTSRIKALTKGTRFEAALAKRLKELTEAIEALKAKGKAIVDKIDGLKKQAKFLEERIEALTKSIDDFVQNELPTFKRAYETWKKNLADAAKELEQTEKKLKDIEPKFTKAQNEFTEIDGKVTRLSKEVEDLGESRAALGVEIKPLTEARQAKRIQAQKLKTATEDLGRAAEKEAGALSEFNRLKGLEDGCQGTLTKARNTVSELDQKVRDSTVKIQRCDGRIKVHENRAAAKAKEISALNEQLGKQEGRLAELKGEIPSSEGALKNVNADLGRIQAELDRLPSSIEQTEKALKQARADKEFIAQQLREGSEIAPELEQRLSNLQLKEAELETQLSGMQSRQQILTERSGSLKADQGDLEAKIQRLTKERDTLQTSVSEGKTKAQGLDQEQSQIQEDLGMERELRDELNVQLNEANGKLPDARTAVTDAEREAKDAADKTKAASDAHKEAKKVKDAEQTKYDEALKADGDAQTALGDAQSKLGEKETRFNQQGERLQEAKGELGKLDGDHKTKKKTYDDLKTEKDGLETAKQTQTEKKTLAETEEKKAKETLDTAEKNLATDRESLAKVKEQRREAAQRLVETTQEGAENTAAIAAKEEEAKTASATQQSGSEGHQQRAGELAHEIDQRSKTWWNKMMSLAETISECVTSLFSYLKQKLFGNMVGEALFAMWEKVWAKIQGLCQAYMSLLRWLVTWLDGLIAGVFTQLKDGAGRAGIQLAPMPNDLGQVMTSFAKTKFTTPPGSGKQAAKQTKKEAMSEEETLIATVGKLFFDNVLWSMDQAVLKFTELEKKPQINIAELKTTSASIKKVNQKLAWFLDHQRQSRANAESFGGLQSFGLSFEWTDILMMINWLQFVASWGCRVIGLLTSWTGFGLGAFPLADLIDLIGGAIRSVLSFTFIVVPMKVALFLMSQFPRAIFAAAFEEGKTDAAQWLDREVGEMETVKGALSNVASGLQGYLTANIYALAAKTEP